MVDANWLEQEARHSLGRLLPRLEAEYAVTAGSEDWQAFKYRLEAHFPRLFQLLRSLYGQHHDFASYLEKALKVATASWLARSAELKTLDAEREANPIWFQSNQMLGGVCYVDLFSSNLERVREKIPYFTELGLTYLHLMPPFRCPEGNSDGGYAVSSYREVNPVLGTVDQLKTLATEMRHNGISLVLDFVFNHTSDEHAWALRARAGDPTYMDFYHVFSDREMPDAYGKTLREVFPDEHPGSFTYIPEMGRWVWTTFHSFQWDLNYANPAVFNAMAEELLSLANLGVEVLRLDAVAFIWKRLGTACENLPEAHQLIQAFNALTRIAAPALLFKSEAIVHPDEVVKYIHRDECQISYNPLLMALLWNSLATRKVRLLTQAMRKRFQIPPDCAWVNYVRVHDDIGWTFSDEDAALLGVNAYDHRQFLNAYYTGRFPGSFAIGLPFQENPKTGDCRISGTCASLAGLERAMADSSPLRAVLIEHAIRRILLIYGVVLSIGGIPLIYLGDEIGLLNDYRYKNDPAKVDDSRWVHRPFANWEQFARRHDQQTIEGRVYQGLSQLVEARKNTPAVAIGHMNVVDTGSDHVFGYVRGEADQYLTVLANFSDETQTLDVWRLHLPPQATDLISGQAQALATSLNMEPYQQLWLIAG